uniref:LamG-like jellyroll fold domain-containing protein n=1 Tax=Mariniflexile sp. TaxID=1979402 RepID=UPI003566A1DD
SDVITIANDNLLNFENEVSFSVWIKPDSQQNAMVLGKSNYSTATNYVLRTQANNFIEYAHKTRNFSNNNPLNIGQWNHIAVISHSTSEREIYVNNQLTTFTSQPDSYGLVSNLISIGAAYHFGSYYAEFFNGSIDDIRIYNMALSASDVSSLYTNNSLGIKKNTLAQNNNFYVFNKCIYFNENQNLSEINSITIYNLLAQKIYESTEIQKENPIKFLKQGVYILKVEHKNNLIITKKFVMR